MNSRSAQCCADRERDGRRIGAFRLRQFTWRLQRSADPADGGRESLLSTVGFERIESVDGADEGKTVTVTYGSAFADWQGPRSGCSYTPSPPST